MESPHHVLYIKTLIMISKQKGNVPTLGRHLAVASRTAGEVVGIRITGFEAIPVPSQGYYILRNNPARIKRKTVAGGWPRQVAVICQRVPRAF